MIEVELPDGRILEFPEGTSQDDMRAAIAKLTANDAPAPAEQSTLQRIWREGMDNLRSDGDDTSMNYGETAAAAINNAAEAVTFGLAGDEMAGRMDEMIGRREPGTGADFYRQQEQQLRQESPGVYWGSEILPAMAAPGAAIAGAGRGLLSRIAGGAAVGAAGGASFGGMEADGGDRVQGAVQGGLIGGFAGGLIPAAGNLVSRVVSPMRNADPVRGALATVLEKAGVRNLTAGQRTGSERLLRAERMVEPAMDQIEDFTAAAMRTTGSTARRATRENIAAAERAIVQRMDDALQGVTVTPNATMAQAADDIAAAYIENVPQGQLTPRIRGMVNEIIEQATSANPQPITLSQMRKWRTDIGRMTTSTDPATREAAHALRDLIDDATDSALRAAGRADDIAALSEARVQYRNILAIEDAASRAGVNNRLGIVSPEALQGAVTRTQGRRNVVRGQGTDLAELSHAGSAVLARLPAVMAGGERILPQATNASMMGLGGGLGFQLGGPVGAAAGAVAGGLLGSVGRSAGSAALRSGPVAGLISNRLAATPGALDAPLQRGLLGALAAQ